MEEDNPQKISEIGFKLRDFESVYDVELMKDPNFVLGLLEELVDELIPDKKRIGRDKTFNFLDERYHKTIEMYLEMGKIDERISSLQERYEVLVDKVDEASREHVYNFNDEKMDLADRRERKDLAEQKNRLREADRLKYFSIFSVSLGNSCEGQTPIMMPEEIEMD